MEETDSNGGTEQRRNELSSMLQRATDPRSGSRNEDAPPSVPPLLCVIPLPPSPPLASERELRAELHVTGLQNVGRLEPGRSVGRVERRWRLTRVRRRAHRCVGVERV